MSDTKTAETDVITCDACPVLCRIREGKSGACSRYANFEGKLTRTDPLVVTQHFLISAMPPAHTSFIRQWPLLIGQGVRAIC